MHDDDIIQLIGRGPLVLPLFAMVLCRVGGLMLAAPIFGSNAVPVRIRGALAMAISAVMFPLIAPKLPADVTLIAAIPGVLGELMIGLIIGLSLSLVFAGMQLAGMIIGQQAGLALGQVFNPVLNTETTIIGQLFFLAALAAFVLVGGHRELLRALLDTYDAIPVLSFRLEMSHVDLIAGLLSAAYALGLRLAAPVLLALLIATLSLGFLSRTMPQLNILSIGFPVRVLIALCTAGFVLAASGELLSDALVDAFDQLRLVLGME